MRINSNNNKLVQYQNEERKFKNFYVDISGL